MARRHALYFGLFGLLAASVVSVFVGVIDLSPRDLFTNPEALGLLFLSRLPRTLAVIITGASLATSGMIMQALVRNRFVEPTTAGVGQGAAIGILIAALFFPAQPLLVKMVMASTLALASSVFFLVLVQRLPPTQPLLIPLVGLIYGGILNAGMTFFAYQYDLLQYVSVWTNGEFSGVLRGRYEIIWIAAIVAVLTYFVADQFAIVGLGRDASINLGLKYKQVVLLGLIAISIVTALTVVTVGMIPFVGLVVPNLISRHFGDNLRATLPMTALSGAILVLISDIIGRLVRFPYEVPVGTVFGVIGAAIFLRLLFTRPRHG